MARSTRPRPRWTPHSQSYKNASTAYEAADATYGVHFSDDYSGALREEAARTPRYLAAKSTYDTLVATDMSPAQASADAGVSQAYAGYKAAQASLKKAQAADPPSQKSAAQAAVTSAAKALELAQNSLNDATLVAPIDGTVFFNATGAPGADGKTPLPAAGAAVAPQAAPFSVVDLGGSTFIAEVDEADIDRVAWAWRPT